MTQNSNIQKKVDDALNSLDSIRPASPAPYFYTRLSARLDKNQRNIWENFAGYISQPAVAFATVLLIVLLNTMALFKKDSAVRSAIEQNEQSLNSTYDVASNTANNNILTIWNPEDDQSAEK